MKKGRNFHDADFTDSHYTIILYNQSAKILI